MGTPSGNTRTSIKAFYLPPGPSPVVSLAKKNLPHQVHRFYPPLKRHSFAIQVNPWSMSPLPRSLAALQHHSLLLAAQQQSLQHALLKHILACSDLNSRVRGIAAYEEYEALLREIKGRRFSISIEELESFSQAMNRQIEKIFDHHPRLQHQYSETQRRILQASWHTMRELLADENRTSPHFLQVKRIQHCWILYHFSKL